MTQDIDPHTERNYPWIPDVPSRPLSSALQQNNNGDERTALYPTTRLAAQFLQSSSGDIRSRWERVGEWVGELGKTIGVVGLPIFGGWQGWGLLDEISNGIFPLAFIFGVVALGPIGMFLGGIPGFIIRDRAKTQRLEQEEAHLRVGENEALSKISDLVTKNATGSGDVLWDMWEDLTELADEAADARQDAGPAQLTVYNDNIAGLANRIARSVEQRQALKVDAQQIQTELESSSDTELAELLNERLTQKSQMWDRLAPIDNKEQGR